MRNVKTGETSNARLGHVFARRASFTALVFSPTIVVVVVVTLLFFYERNETDGKAKSIQFQVMGRKFVYPV